MPSQRKLRMVAEFQVRRAPQGGPSQQGQLTFTPTHSSLGIFFSLSIADKPRAIVKLTCRVPTWVVQLNQVIQFDSDIDIADVDYISSVRSGQDAYVGWKMDINGFLSGANNACLLASVQEQSNFPDDFLQISPQQFRDKFITPSGLSDRLVVEVPMASLNADLEKNCRQT